MNKAEILSEAENRRRSAGLYRGAAVLLWIVSGAGFALATVFRNETGAWADILPAAAVVLSALSLAVGAVSILKLRCPSCGRILSPIRSAAYCPSCGTALQPGEVSLRIPADEEGEAALSVYAEETYPKEIRLFTTADEDELTRRYIRLIGRDNRRLQEREEVSPDGEAAAGAESGEEESEGGLSSKPWWRIEKEKEGRQMSPYANFISSVLRFLFRRP